MIGFPVPVTAFLCTSDGMLATLQVAECQLGKLMCAGSLCGARKRLHCKMLLHFQRPLLSILAIYMAALFSMSSFTFDPG